MLVVQAVFLHASVRGESGRHMWRNLHHSGQLQILPPAALPNPWVRFQTLILLSSAFQIYFTSLNRINKCVGQRLPPVAKRRRCRLIESDPLVSFRVHARAGPGQKTGHLPGVLLRLQISWKRLSSTKPRCKWAEPPARRFSSLLIPLIRALVSVPELSHPHVASRASNSERRRC